MKCGLCGEIMPFRSNAAIAEELLRFQTPFLTLPELACSQEGCSNCGVPVSENPQAYARFGKTAAGTSRWRCNACRSTFTAKGKSTKRQRMPHKNREVFALLVNGTSINRMSEITGLDFKTLYGKIDFLYRQCVAFAAHREKQLLDGAQLPKMYLAVDRQTYSVNWSSRKDRRNVMLTAIGSADIGSQYVFGLHLNFDGQLDPDEVEKDAQDAGDYEVAEPYRKFARLWLKQDYAQAVAASPAVKEVKRAKTKAIAQGMDPLVAQIAAGYAETKLRDDMEERADKDEDVALPKLGMQVRDQYTMHAHFQMLSRLLTGAEKVRIYMDQDSGFRAAFMGAFAERVKARTADGHYVQVMKETTIDQKDAAIAASRQRFEDFAAAHPGFTKNELEILMVKEEMGRMRAIGHWGDRWLEHPFPSRSEPAKKLCWLTDLGNYSDDHAAKLYLIGSLHAIDVFFMLIRRRLSLAERPIASASSDRRMWYGYSAYRPENLAKVLEIFRAFYNYCLIPKTSKDKKSPAMRLGLAKGNVALEDIIYFSPRV